VAPILFRRTHPLQGSPSSSEEPILFRRTHPLQRNPSSSEETILFRGTHHLQRNPSSSEEPILFKVTVPDPVQESMMNALGSYLFHDVVNQT
jgi:hypothetical protein